MRRIRLTCLISVLLLFFGACNKEPDESLTKGSDLLGIVPACLVPESRLALFADLSSFDRLEAKVPDTKSSGAEEFELTELLDFGSMREKYFSGRLFKQVPFKQNGDSLLASIHRSEEPSIESCAFVRKYLIETTGIDDVPFFYVVTMIPEDESDGEVEYDFLNKANFSGICLYSMVDGSHVYGQRYFNGRIFQALLTNKDAEETDDIEYLSLVSRVRTKGDGDDILIPSVCIGYRSIWLNPSYCFGWPGTGQGSGSGSNGSPGYTGPGNAPDQSTAVDPNERLYPTQDECYLEVVSNVGNDKVFDCNGRSYTLGSRVIVVPIDNTPPPLYHRFSSWVGDFSDHEEEAFYLTIDKEGKYSSIAYYDEEKPCIDKNTGKGNPLVNMSIASSATWGNWYGGTFGKTRTDDKTGLPKNHDGVDFAANPGVPVFSMYDGIVTYIKDNSPDMYVKRSYGNQIYIQSTVNGSTITIQYAHLQYGSPIATDPFTESMLTVGSKVFQGQLIGYTGKTGNAHNVPNKHLHLGVIDSSGKYIDPSEFINGDVDAKNQQSKKGRIDNIKCN